MIPQQDIPKGYALCLSADACARHTTCLRALAAQALAESGQTEPAVVQAVNPNLGVSAGKSCPLYRDSHPVRYAWGMTHLFDDIPLKQARELRRKIMGCFSCETYFYQSRKGERPITPDEQKAITAAFRSTGLTDEPRYDRSSEGILW